MRTLLLIFCITIVLSACSKSDDPNLAPNQPNLLLPADGETCESLKPTFSWEASDPEEDDLTYTIWLGTAEGNLTIASDNLPNTRYTPTQDLALSTKYYWQIESHDGTSSTKSVIYSFGTKGEGESGTLPSRPVLVSPLADVSSGDVTFSWDASIGGEGAVSYDLFVQHGDETSFSLQSGNLSATSHIANLSAGSLSWYVEAKDGRGQVSRSVVSSITLN